MRLLSTKADEEVDVLSDLDFELLNKINYKFQYDLRCYQRSASFTYNSQVDQVIDNHLFFGKSTSELQWDNKQKKTQHQKEILLFVRNDVH
ncbi:unnamed protein product [Rotaria sp. Silwood2]|nr:unnamed protein product [Rotaria sp. Silwood2]CAF2675959.1 unnamed protein product [Rotaria sp. Silwood2]CAF2955389.1 unnamed protein product [Rotaria sp. Silwood2]CAF3101186.1 unnamed protein product [Rotaria sp. Silwood2]CAF4405144.1 unnamed protein product [Rotaria sp. Silwood2]